MDKSYLEHLRREISEIKEASLYKSERVISSPQKAMITAEGQDVLNFCANNYLGLADDQRLIDAAKKALDEYGFGLASVRFICGTQTVHKQLEKKLSEFLKTEDTILYSSCFDANGGLFETLLGPEDAIISDSLNHASIIDGVRLCKAKRFRYANNDMSDLKEKLEQARDSRFKLIVTDGVFSMDGIIADLKSVCDLADEYGALVAVDDSHAVGFLGENGRGTPEYCGVLERVDIITGTLGKALGGASGGYTSGRKEIVEMLRQRSRPYLFSNTLAPMIAATSVGVLNIVEKDKVLRQQLFQNMEKFRSEMDAMGFELAGKDHPIIPVMLGDAELASKMADALLAEGIYVIGFSYPVVPKGKARIRVQISAAHSSEDIDRCIAAFKKVGETFKVI